MVPRRGQKPGAECLLVMATVVMVMVADDLRLTATTARPPPSLARRRREEEGDAERSAWLLGWIFATTAAIRARRFRRRNTALSQLADKSKMRDKSDANWQRLSETGGRAQGLQPPWTGLSCEQRQVREGGGGGGRTNDDGDMVT